MKPNACLGLLVVVLLYSNSFGKIITVDNKHPFVGEYTTLQAAHDAAQIGDTIFVSPSLVAYNAINVTKRLIFYGVGYDISNTIGGSNLTLTTLINGEMVFNSGSEHSKLEGFDGSFQIYIRANYITIKRNDLSRIIFEYDLGSGCAIAQNKLIYSIGNEGLIQINGATNIIISNNIIINTAYTGMVGMYCYGIRGGSDLVIRNNVLKAGTNIGYELEVNSSQIINNILLGWNGCTNCTGNAYWYNMSNQSQIPDGNGNIRNVLATNIFVNPDLQDFRLITGSPALGTGENGTDMGIYGGDAPYVDGGFPSLPSILQLKGDLVAAPGSGLNIQFKAKSNK